MQIHFVYYMVHLLLSNAIDEYVKLDLLVCSENFKIIDPSYQVN